MLTHATLAGRRRTLVFVLALIAGSVWQPGSSAIAQSSARVACNQTALLTAIAEANAAGGGTITFDCRASTIPMTLGFGTIQSNVVIDGEDRDIVLEYTTNFAGCSTGDNGIDGPAIGHMREQGSTVRNLTFKHFLESLQIIGPNNVVERNVFLGHLCSDDAVSTLNANTRNATIRQNRIENYNDKGYQMSYGSGTIEGNTFIDAFYAIRGPYDNSAGGTFVIRSNTFTTSGNRTKCSGIRIDGTYHIVFENNAVRCFRGLNLGGGTQAIVRDNLLEENPRQGIQIGGKAVASVSGNTVINNGLTPGGGDPPGGVIVFENGRADLGGGSLVIGGNTVSSSGGNRIGGNGTADVRNLRAGYTMMAQSNCWDHQQVTEILANDTEGTVDVDPPGASCSLPSVPTNLRVIQ